MRLLVALVAGASVACTADTLGLADAGGTDASTRDAGRRDAGVRDAGVRFDAGPIDGGAPRDGGTARDAGTAVCRPQVDLAFGTGALDFADVSPMLNRALTVSDGALVVYELPAGGVSLRVPAESWAAFNDDGSRVVYVEPDEGVSIVDVESVAVELRLDGPCTARLTATRTAAVVACGAEHTLVEIAGGAPVRTAISIASTIRVSEDGAVAAWLEATIARCSPREQSFEVRRVFVGSSDRPELMGGRVDGDLLGVRGDEAYVYGKIDCEGGFGTEVYGVITPDDAEAIGWGTLIAAAPRSGGL